MIGAFEDGALTPFKRHDHPAVQEGDRDQVEFLTEPYDSFFAKAFQDGQTKAGQYDIYIMDDPWIPQYAAAGILEDLGQHGITADADYAPAVRRPGLLAAAEGPAGQGLRERHPQAHRPADDRRPADADLSQRRLPARRRRPGTTSSPGPRRPWRPARSSTASSSAGSRATRSSPRSTRSSCPSAAACSTTTWNPTFNNAQGKAAADFFVGTLKSLAPKGVAEFDSDQEGAAILGGDAAAIIQYSGNAIKSDDPAASKEVGKLDFGVVPKQQVALAQIGIFIHGVSASAPNKDNAIAFMKWYGSNDTQIALARSGDLPVKIPAFSDPEAVKAHRLLPVALAQLNSGAQARPRTPDWGKVESIIGTELNKALVAGSGGGAAMDARRPPGEGLPQGPGLLQLSRPP